MIDVFANESFLVRMAIAMVAAIGMNLVYITGQLNLGQAGFLAVGAYTLAVLEATWGLPLPVCLLAAAGAAAVVALPVALGATRVRGIYLIMGTLAVGEVVRATISSIDDLGGLQGYLLQDPVTPGEVAATLLAVLAAAVVMMASRFGLRMRAVFDDEDAAAAAGVATRRTKVASVVVSAAVVGVAGGLLAKFLHFIAPRHFGILESFEIALFTLIGGVHSLLGAIAGAVVVSSLLQFLRLIADVSWVPGSLHWLAEWRLAVYGILVMVLMAVLPEGLVSRRAALRLTAPFRWVRRRRPWLPEQVPMAAAGGSPEDAVPSGVGTAVPSRVGDAVPSSVGDAVLEIDDVSHRFGGVEALSGVTIAVRPAEIVALIGANGAGKSTLIDIVGGRHRCLTGRVRLHGVDITELRPEARTRMGIARTFQSVRMLDHLTVEEALRLGRLHAAGRNTVPVVAVLDLLGLTDRRDVLPGSLTLADQRRLEIGRAFASAPEILLLDEPSVGMNGDERRELAALVEELRRWGVAIVVVDHNLDLALGVADRVVVLDFGSVLATGTPDEILADPRVRQAYLGAGVVP